MFASTSSVYGNQKSFPISENANTDHPESFYAASKKLMKLWHIHIQIYPRYQLLP